MDLSDSDFSKYIQLITRYSASIYPETQLPSAFCPQVLIKASQMFQPGGPLWGNGGKFYEEIFGMTDVRQKGEFSQKHVQRDKED